jgi:hypothetical protein
MFNHPLTPLLDAHSDGDGAGVPQQQENWEARFKGLQREHNKLRSENETLAAQLEAARGAAAEAQQQVVALRDSTRAETVRYEGQIAELSGKLSTATSEITKRDTQVADLTGQLERAGKRDASRKFLNDVNFPERSALVPFYEAGMLQIDDLEGEARDTRIGEALALISGRAAEAFQNLMGGTTPPPPANIGAESAVGKLSTDDLNTWLMEPGNMGKPEYEAYRQAYLNKLSKAQ